MNIDVRPLRGGLLPFLSFSAMENGPPEAGGMVGDVLRASNVIVFAVCECKASEYGGTGCSVLDRGSAHAVQYTRHLGPGVNLCELIGFLVDREIAVSVVQGLQKPAVRYRGLLWRSDVNGTVTALGIWIALQVATRTAGAGVTVEPDSLT